MAISFYDQAFIFPSQRKLESIQYNAWLTITEAIRGTSKENLKHKLVFETVATLLHKTKNVLQNLQELKLKISFLS